MGDVTRPTIGVQIVINHIARGASLNMRWIINQTLEGRMVGGAEEAIKSH